MADGEEGCEGVEGERAGGGKGPSWQHVSLSLVRPATMRRAAGPGGVARFSARSSFRQVGRARARVRTRSCTSHAHAYAIVSSRRA